jgi:hypothetical protein
MEYLGHIIYPCELGFKRPMLKPFHMIPSHRMLVSCDHFWACVTITNNLLKDLVALLNL